MTVQSWTVSRAGESILTKEDKEQIRMVSVFISGVIVTSYSSSSSTVKFERLTPLAKFRPV